MKPFRSYRFWLIGALFAAFGSNTFAQVASVSARFEPEILSVGDVAAYAIVFENMSITRIPEVRAPAAPGLRVIGTSPQQSQRTSIINGRASSEISLIWQVSATREGSITVPAQTVRVNGELHEVPAATLRVVPPDERTRNLFRLEWDLPDRSSFYVGEAIPAFLRLLVRADLSAQRPLPDFRIPDGLLVTPLDRDPEITREEVDGITYNAVYWSVILTPIRAQSQTLSAAAELIYEDPRSPRYTNDFFFRRRAPERKLLSTPEVTVDAREVPTEGRPAGYNGAIGRFEVSTETDHDVVRAGEPVTLRMHLNGSGNFDRVAAPAMPETDGWRIYPPRVTFTPNDALGFTGTKTFEYILIPTSDSLERTPAIPFAAFNPYSESFVDLTVEALRITVNPAPVAALPPAQATPPTGAGPAVREPQWRSFRAELGTVSAGVRPVMRTAPFWISQGVLALAALALILLRRRHTRLSQDEVYARRVSGSRSARNQLKRAEAAAAAGDAETFYLAAQRAVQEAVGRHFPRSRKAESLTLPEVDAKLSELDLGPDPRATAATLFGAADALRYAGLSQDSATLQEHHQRLVQLLRAIP